MILSNLTYIPPYCHGILFLSFFFSVLFFFQTGGVAVGSFEANLLSAITPLGHKTKCWATLGIPIGVASITMGAFGAMAAGLPVEYVYGFVSICLLGSMFVFIFILPYKVKKKKKNLKMFLGFLGREGVDFNLK